MAWYPRDFVCSTRTWPLEARGVYRELLDAQWDMGGSGVGTLPDDEEQLRELARATPEQWRIAWRLVEPKFPRVEGGRRNPRLEQHREAALAVYLGRRKGAEKTNSKRWPSPRPPSGGDRSPSRSPNRSAIAQRQLSESPQPQPQPQPQPPPEEPRSGAHRPPGSSKVLTLSGDPYQPATEAEAISEVFAYWASVMHKPKVVLDEKRRNLIRTRLRDGWTPEQLMTAIAGNAGDEWSQGANDRGKPFNELSLILRDAEHIERFIELAKCPRRPRTNAGRRTERNVDAAKDFMRRTEPEVSQ